MEKLHSKHLKKSLADCPASSIYCWHASNNTCENIFILFFHCLERKNDDKILADKQIPQH